MFFFYPEFGWNRVQISVRSCRSSSGKSLASHCRGPGSRPGRHMWFVVDKVALGQAFSEYFYFPCQSSFHKFLHHHDHPGLAQ
jgi:hypothetical protein